MHYLVYWNGTPIRYKTLISARKSTLAKMSKEWVHHQAIYSENGDVVGEIHRTAVDDEWSVVKARDKPISRYTLYSDGSIKAKSKKR